MTTEALNFAKSLTCSSKAFALLTEGRGHHWGWTFSSRDANMAAQLIMTETSAGPSSCNVLSMVGQHGQALTCPAAATLISAGQDGPVAR